MTENFDKLLKDLDIMSLNATNEELLASNGKARAWNIEKIHALASQFVTDGKDKILSIQKLLPIVRIDGFKKKFTASGYYLKAQFEKQFKEMNCNVKIEAINHNTILKIRFID